MCCEERYLTIYKGEDSAAFGVRKIRIYLVSELPSEVASARFSIYSFSRDFSAEEIAKNEMFVELTCDDTASMPLGRAYASFRMFDGEGRLFTASTRIPVLVKSGGAPACFDNRGVVVCSDIAVVKVAVDIDYELLKNLPRINGVEVSGDRLGRDYDLNKIPEYSPAATYRVGEQCLHEKSFFSCVVQIDEPEEWNPENWEGIGLSGRDNDAVHYTADTEKSDVEKATARNNIGAASAMESVKLEALKKAVANPESVKLAPASIKEYLVSVYNAIQSISNLS